MISTYREKQPECLLGDFIECFWQYKNENSDRQYTILPHGYFELIAEFDSETLKEIRLRGIWTQPKKVLLSSSSTIFGIRFKLSAVEYLFNKSISCLLNTQISLHDDFWNISSYPDKGFDNLVDDLSNMLKTRLKGCNSIDNRKMKLFNMLYENVSYNVEEIADMVGWSSRQINRYFNNQLGCQLKELLNIVRCQTSIQFIVKGVYSAQKGFYDQSHYIK